MYLEVGLYIYYKEVYKIQLHTCYKEIHKSVTTYTKNVH